MDTAIANMTNKGMKNIADLSIEAFVDLMLDQGTVTIGDDEYDKDTLIKIWTDVAKDAFKQASKGKKTKAKQQLVTNQHEPSRGTCCFVNNVDLP